MANFPAKKEIFTLQDDRMSFMPTIYPVPPQATSHSREE